MKYDRSNRTMHFKAYRTPKHYAMIYNTHKQDFTTFIAVPIIRDQECALACMWLANATPCRMMSSCVMAKVESSWAYYAVPPNWLHLNEWNDCIFSRSLKSRSEWCLKGCRLDRFWAFNVQNEIEIQPNSKLFIIIYCINFEFKKTVRRSWHLT